MKIWSMQNFNQELWRVQGGINLSKGLSKTNLFQIEYMFCWHKSKLNRK